MNNCGWMDRVLPTFIDPYLKKTGKWQQIEANCKTLGQGWMADRLCAEEMARNHIFNDLLPALQKFGCGSDADWNQVFLRIQGCTSQRFDNVVESAATSWMIYLYRQVVRNKCTQTRLSLNQNQEINNDLAGRGCLQ